MAFDDTTAPGTTGTAEDRSTARTPIARLKEPIDTGLTRPGLKGPFSRDLTLGVVVAVVSLGLFRSVQLLADEAGTPFDQPALGVLATLVCAQSLVLCVRRRSPVLCLTLVVAAQAGVVALTPGDVAFYGLATMIVAYTYGALVSLPRLLAILSAITGGLGLLGFVFALPPLSSLAPPAEVDLPLFAALSSATSAAVSFGVPALIGNDVSTRRRFAQSERDRAAEAQRERTDRAIRAERTRMARELHDIAAHHLAGMVVQAGAAERLIGRDDRAAGQMVAHARSQGKETLDSLRMMVGTLREPGESPQGMEGEHGGGADSARATPGDSPAPGLSALDRLVEGERASGAAVEVIRTGHTYDLPPVADATFYRVAQEALTNVRDHAPGARLWMRLGYSPSAVALEVENGPGAERTEPSKTLRGMGLIGMRERAELIGAVLETGATDSGGWRVRITLSFAREYSAAGADRATAKETPHDQGCPGG